MLERMRKKQFENREKQKLALIDPVEAANCKRYNLSEKQLRAVRRVGLRLACCNYRGGGVGGVS